MNKIISLTHEQEIKLLYSAQKGKSKQEKEKAVRLLVYYNQPFVKFLVRGAYYPQSEISPEDLVTEGTIALIKAVENFDLSKAKEYRLASYAGYWIRQRIQSLIKKHQMFPKILQKRYTGNDYYKLLEIKDKASEIEIKEAYKKLNLTKNPTKFLKKEKREPSEDDIEEWKKIQNAYENLSDPEKRKAYDQVKKNMNQTSRKEIIYYDSKYNKEKDEKAASLVNTLVDESEEKQIEDDWLKTKINELLEVLEYQDNLLIRLFFGITPINLNQLYPLVTAEKKKQLENLFNKQDPKNVILVNQVDNPLINKYTELLSIPRKKEELVELIKKENFWEYFANFADLSNKNNLDKKSYGISKKKEQLKIDKKQWNNIPEQEIGLWTDLGYQPEDINDPINCLLKNMNISKSVKETWEKVATKNDKDKESILNIKLEKWVELRRKNALTKLKKTKEDLKMILI